MDKWRKLKEYLENKEKEAITNIGKHAMTGDDLKTDGIQLNIVRMILAHVERLDHDDDVVGRPAPPKHNY